MREDRRCSGDKGKASQGANWDIHQHPPDLVPARMLNEYACCPRLAYLEWVQGEFADSADTVEGRFQRRRVDRPSGKMSAPFPSHGTPNEDETTCETIHARSVMLSDHALGAIARIDLIESQGNVVTPVDYKHGKAPDVPEGHGSRNGSRYASRACCSAPTDTPVTREYCTL